MNATRFLVAVADMAYDTHTGRIAPGLFGIGIAFPEVIVDKLGNEEQKIGLE